MPDVYDVAIVGAGPAGATLARLIGGRFATAVIDKKGASDGFRKPCGGLLSPDAQRALSRFDMTLPTDVLVSPQIFTVKTMDLETGRTAHYQRCYLNMDRARFDRWLMDAMPDGVDLYRGVCTSVERRNGVYVLRTGDAEICARILVGADGAASVVRSFLYPRAPLKRYVAIQQHFRASAERPFYSCIFDPTTSRFCSWAISKDDTLIYGGVFEPKGCREAFEAQKKRLPKADFDLRTPIYTEACAVLRPEGVRQFRLGYDNAFLVGEAAGFISPTSFEGISWAITGASLLADALTEHAGHIERAERLYRAKTRAMRAKLYAKQLKAPFMYNRVLRNLILRSGLRAVKLQTPCAQTESRQSVEQTEDV